MSISMRGSLLVGLVAMTLSPGCADPETRFGEFLDGTKDHRFTGMEEGESSDPDDTEEIRPVGDISGAFLLALDTVISPGQPLLFVVTVDMTTYDEGGGEFDLCFMPLTVDTKEFLPPELCYAGVEVRAEGGFSLDMGVVMIAGAANPITGSDIEAALVQNGQIIDADAWCGDITGDLINPLEVGLAGSTFAAIRLEDDGSNPDTLPTTFPVSCADLI